MLSDKNSPQYLLRMGSHAERSYIEWAKPLFDALLLNANLVEGTPAASLSLVEALDDKPYLIDPISYAFALPVAYLQSSKINKKTGLETVSTKRTFQKLAERFGEPFTETVGNRPLVPTDFSDGAVRVEAVNRILAYQRQRLEEEQPDSGPLRIPGESIQPKGLIIPYFITNQSLTWHPTNIRMINDAVAQKTDLPLYAMLLIDRTLLQDQETSLKAVQAYCATKADGFFIWISDQIEQSMGRQEVSNFVKFVQKLCSEGRPTYNMYGGYLSALLSKFGLTGLCHSVGYGEHRNVIPVVGGGVPQAKYYFPPLHQAFMFADIQTVIANIPHEKYYSDVCNCPICHSVINTDFQSNFQKYGEIELKGIGKAGQTIFGQTANSIQICRGHYLAARFLEIIQIRENDIQSLVARLKEAEQTYMDPSGFPSTGYLSTWAEGISDNSPK